MIKSNCHNCNLEFKHFPCEKSKYCSRKCYWISLKGKPSRKKNGIIKICDICGKKFYTALSQNHKTCSSECFHKSRRGKSTWNKGLSLIGIFSDEKIANFKKIGVGMSPLHEWVVRRLGKPSKCEFCGTMEKRKYHWANKSGEYKRDLNDWLRLCVPCHKKYDLSR